MATTDQWRTIEGWAEHLTGVRQRASSTAACLLDLRRRVEALEQRTAPAPAPAADRPLWEVMAETYHESPDYPECWAAVLDVVATWLERRYLDRYPGAAELLRNEARRARKGQ